MLGSLWRINVGRGREGIVSNLEEAEKTYPDGIADSLKF